LDLSVGECESDHSETTRMTRLREKRHSSFSQILMRGSIILEMTTYDFDQARVAEVMERA
jgi:hypothetical protein